MDLSETFEGQKCSKFNLIHTNDFRVEYERNQETKGLILVHDRMSESQEAEILNKFPPGSVKLVGALWFYLSVYFNMELPVDIFEPSAQRANFEKEFAPTEEGEVPNEGNSALVRRILLECLTRFSENESGDTSKYLNWAEIHSENYAKISEAREARRKRKQMEE